MYKLIFCLVACLGDCYFGGFIAVIDLWRQAAWFLLRGIPTFFICEWIWIWRSLFYHWLKMFNCLCWRKCTVLYVSQPMRVYVCDVCVVFSKTSIPSGREGRHQFPGLPPLNWRWTNPKVHGHACALQDCSALPSWNQRYIPLLNDRGKFARTIWRGFFAWLVWPAIFEAEFLICLCITLVSVDNEVCLWL